MRPAAPPPPPPHTHTDQSSHLAYKPFNTSERPGQSDRQTDTFIEPIMAICYRYLIETNIIKGNLRRLSLRLYSR